MMNDDDDDETIQTKIRGGSPGGRSETTGIGFVNAFSTMSRITMICSLEIVT